MTAECESFLDLIPDYRWLGADERSRVQAHAAQCPRCAAELELSEAADAALSGCEEFRAPAAFTGSVMAGIRRAHGPGRQPSRVVGVLALVLVLEIVLIALGPRGLMTLGYGAFGAADAAGRAAWGAVTALWQDAAEAGAVTIDILAAAGWPVNIVTAVAGAGLLVALAGCALRLGDPAGARARTGSE